eukprot:TRINITY_DN491_c0_g1_i3.p1 TRINITY_DN491_c0_g1~~TRINITY_DN491_c0_g1_i3.p1  ORF type:complete len:232 (+),score=43.78 TRINITY_DN491_c0_g1_i3:40-735(+)
MDFRGFFGRRPSLFDDFFGDSFFGDPFHLDEAYTPWGQQRHGRAPESHVEVEEVQEDDDHTTSSTRRGGGPPRPYVQEPDDPDYHRPPPDPSPPPSHTDGTRNYPSGGFFDDFGGFGFGFGPTSRAVQSDPSSYSYSSCTVSTSAPGGISETRHTVHDSRSGTEKSTHTRTISGKSKTVTRERDMYGVEQRTEALQGTEEYHANEFEREWEDASRNLPRWARHASGQGAAC